MLDRYPGLIAHIVDQDDVAVAIESGRRHRMPIAVRGGGHRRRLRQLPRGDDGLREAYEREALARLELIPLPEAADALARRSEAGDVLAARALARRRDPRALKPLVGMLADVDAARALSGADGLRDLRHSEAGEALLAVTHHSDPDVAVCAAHALITMKSSHVSEPLEALMGSEDDEARRLSQSPADA